MLKDVRVASDGTIVSVVVMARGGETEVPAAAGVQLGEPSRAA
jgi:hypothetical protein